MAKPSVEQMTSFQAAFDYFNAALFGNALPQVILNFSTSSSRPLAYFISKRWQRDGSPEDDESLDEISLNPEYLGRSLDEVFASLVHEMCHQWQYQFGKISRVGYHNRQWAEKMEELGLMPNDGAGKKTGQRMSQEIMEGGAFAQAYERMPENFRLPWRVFVNGKEKKPKGRSGKRTKYTCPGCGVNVWGKEDLEIVCRGCGVLFGVG